MRIKDRELLAAGSPARRFAFPAAVAAAILVAAPCALAAQPSPGARIAKDPVTGELRAPTVEESAALDAAPAPRAQRGAARRGMVTGTMNPAPIQHADGSVEQELDESSLSYSVARKGPDGKVSTYCVTGPQAAAAVMKGKRVVVQTAKESHRDEK